MLEAQASPPALPALRPTSYMSLTELCSYPLNRPSNSQISVELALGIPVALP
jgi:hypothetical protein